MREAEFYFPVGEGTTYRDAETVFEQLVADVAGDYTVLQGTGTWRDETGKTWKEPAIIYIVAVPEDDYIFERVKDCFLKMLRTCGEKAAYYVKPDGEVIIATL